MDRWESGALILDKVCPYCNQDIKAYPKRITNQVGWSDAEGVRTNRVSIEFEAVHQCGPVRSQPGR